MYQCGECEFTVNVRDLIKSHMLEEHGINHLKNFIFKTDKTLVDGVKTVGEVAKVDSEIVKKRTDVESEVSKKYKRSTHGRGNWITVEKSAVGVAKIDEDNLPVTVSLKDKKGKFTKKSLHNKKGSKKSINRLTNKAENDAFEEDCEVEAEAPVTRAALKRQMRSNETGLKDSENQNNCLESESNNERLEVPIMNPKIRGQTMCNSCGKKFNNRSRPKYCSCGYSLIKADSSDLLNAFELKDSIFSVREHRAGIGKRVIVNVGGNVCYSENCLEIKPHYEKNTFECVHLKACQTEEVATKVILDVNSIKEFIQNEATITAVNNAAEAGNLTVFLLPNDNVALSSFLPKSHECLSGVIHINLRKMKCPLRKCSKQPGSHFLVKADMMCIHILVCKLTANKTSSQPNMKGFVPKSTLFSKLKSAEFVVSKIMKHIPSPLDEEEEEFLQESFLFQTELLNSKTGIENFTVITECVGCGAAIEKRNRKLSHNLIVTPGYMKEVEIETSICKKCNILYYPDLYKKGFVPISDNLLVSLSYLVDSRNQMVSGNKLYNHFFLSLKRLVLENKELARKKPRVDCHNLAIKLAKCAVSYNTAVLVKGVSSEEDCLSKLLCLHCGIAPITLMSDGNAKNSIFLNAGCDNLVFEKNDDEIPTLEDFIKQCVVTIAGTSLFQNYEKPIINVFKLPLILSKKISGPVFNRESLKKSNFNRKFDLSQVDLTKVSEMFSSGRFDLLKSRELNLTQLRDIAKDIKIPRAGKLSKIMIENTVLQLFNMLIAGRGNCHKYVHSLGETGGWTDDWCPHAVKYGSKMMVLQESVIDPADIYLSLLFPPVLQIMDDPCTMVNHLVCSEPEFAKLMFGPNRGCFEPPHPKRRPKSCHDCPDILPQSVFPRKFDKTLLDNPDEKVHPISKVITRKVLGTKLSESHKTQNECLFHNINLCDQASCIKTMSQEGLQMRRKSKRVAPGKRQSFESHFCFNFLLDVLENKRTREKQEVALAKHGKFSVDPKTLVADFET